MVPLERALTSPSPDVPAKTRARALLSKMELSSAVEDLGTEMNKVFMLVHGRGLGMGGTGGGRYRRGSALRPKEGGLGVAKSSATSSLGEHDRDSGIAGEIEDGDTMQEDSGSMDYDE
jgi:hypothetical protein